MQKHAARRLHYDFRLEVDGVLKSWAVPKGPSLDPSVKRLAIMVEDHPYDYKDFEGIIPEGYGAGTVWIWDKGVYSVNGSSGKESEALIKEGLKKGEIRFFLAGEKLKGEFVLVKLKQKIDEWLLIKVKDHFVSQKEVTKNPILQKGKPKGKPHHLEPMLATLIDKPFDNEEWIFELKIDGFRALSELNGSDVEIYSRNLKPFNARFPLIVQDLKKLKLDAILDGEIAAVDEKGIPRFQLLQNQMSTTDTNIHYYIFDILYLDGRDLRNLPLIERKAILKEVLSQKKSARVFFLDHVEAKGKAFLKIVKKKEIEGIIGKHKQSLYKVGRRSTSWVKIKAYHRQEAVICGFTEPRKSRQNFGALILGVYKRRKLHYIGHVGGGFAEKKLKEIKELLLPDVQKKCPFEVCPRTNTKVTWVKPKHLCEVRFSEWTDEGIMRQPIFMGLRDDKSPRETSVETPMETKKVVQKQHET